VTLPEWAAVAQIIGSVATVLLAGLTLAYVIATRAMVGEMRRSREAAERPTIVAYIEYLRVDNLAAGSRADSRHAHHAAIGSSRSVPSAT
jgi:hypothetical protein